VPDDDLFPVAGAVLVVLSWRRHELDAWDQILIAPTPPPRATTPETAVGGMTANDL
jgi:hypothetical protein